ncbi:hypothetical protein GCM10010353_67030 [Streptomyces chryseus]|uniref:Uncharacterized protein n=1 Tax=Streptomyces chryseus TaxID=68186 RepID=A0ABQ3EEH7_9ACTN|nr:hypothetical protein GCM10010353_67030 [Streptomyces chryseus]GHB31568.1 hypothetical protein GCM10010346_63700 [Streptomyces chryseus]
MKLELRGALVRSRSPAVAGGPVLLPGSLVERFGSDGARAAKDGAEAECRRPRPGFLVSAVYLVEQALPLVQYDGQLK